VSGTVTDASGGAVAGAQVTMNDTDKGQVHAATTTPAGQYILPNLPVGPYRLEVKANGGDATDAMSNVNMPFHSPMLCRNSALRPTPSLRDSGRTPARP
jgi:hypothetical protein